MSGEAEWAQSIQSRLKGAFDSYTDGDWKVNSAAGRKLTYANEVLEYHASRPTKLNSPRYQTDILVHDENLTEDWVPRIVVECKLGSVTTHDALTYSTKAATHKHVHPYLRYGILVGNFGSALPGRLIRHGAYFDFMMTWQQVEPTNSEWKTLVTLLQNELKASRALQRLLSGRRRKNQETFNLLHRPLVLR